MGSSSETKSNKPQDTPFKQQRLRAWQPILTPKWVIGTFFVVGVLFVPVGVVLKLQADGVYEQAITYDAEDAIPGLETTCHVLPNEPNSGYKDVIEDATGDNPYSCKLEFTLDRDVDSDLYMYYQLDNFYQNHRRYVKSRSDGQLRNTDMADSVLETSCDPSASYKVQVNSSLTEVSRTYYPCGLIALSYFNDAFLINSVSLVDEGRTTAARTIEYDHSMSTDDTAPKLVETDIAWATDLSKKFMNPTTDNVDDERFLYLWQQFAQMSCYSDTDKTRQACTTWNSLNNIALLDDAAEEGCASCPVGSTAVYQGGLKPPADLFDAAGAITDGAARDQESAEGVRNEHFIIWMRTAGLPTFRKLYGRVTAPEGGFKEGDKVSINVVSNFEVGSFKGKKSLVLTTVSPLGGKNDVLGLAYMSVGGICLVLALGFFVKEQVAPRKLGDPAHFKWT